MSCLPFQRINLDELQDNIVVQSELLDLKADHKCDVKGSVIESKIDIRRGKQVTTLIQSGTLKKGDLLIAGSSSAKVYYHNYIYCESLL